jgi:hypothetical protein
MTLLFVGDAALAIGIITVSAKPAAPAAFQSSVAPLRWSF